MPNQKRKQQINLNKKRIASALRKAQGKTIDVHCGFCDGKVGIPTIPILRGVESDIGKTLPTKIIKTHNLWLCANEKCGQRGAGTGNTSKGSKIFVFVEGELTRQYPHDTVETTSK